MIPEDLIQQGQLVAGGFLLAALIYYVLLRPRILANYEKRIRKSKDQFVGLASHYLLTPITIIQTANSRLQEDDISMDVDERKRLYDAIELGQRRLWIIAEQLVLINEIDHNSIQLRLDVQNMSELVSEAIAAVDVFARHKQLKVEFIDQTKDVREVRVDSRRMRQALTAVLDNAIKFSVENGKITVRLSLEESIFRIEVGDDGIGMSPDVLSHVQEKFYRGTNLYNFDYEGLGLGLHIAYAILRMHQGDITISSKPNRGSTVVIEFPIP